jgi:hypothetical protein
LPHELHTLVHPECSRLPWRKHVLMRTFQWKRIPTYCASSEFGRPRFSEALKTSHGKAWRNTARGFDMNGTINCCQNFRGKRKIPQFRWFRKTNKQKHYEISWQVEMSIHKIYKYVNIYLPVILTQSHDPNLWNHLTTSRSWSKFMKSFDNI